MNNDDGQSEFWAFSKATQVLEARHGATPTELAAWAMFGPGPELGSIAI